MSKIEDLGAPIILEGVVVLNASLRVMGDVSDANGNPLRINLNAEQSALFIDFCKISRIKQEIERDLQNLFGIDGINYLTAHIPLITFIQEFHPNANYDTLGFEKDIADEIIGILVNQNSYKNPFNEVLAYITDQISSWKHCGVDLVSISGVQLY